jgi:antitoxin component YwqK of YwqJK toxin-antitoxin module
MEKAYWEDGKPMEEIPYLDGKREGTAKYYNLDGDLIEEKLWEDGELVGTRRVKQ